MAKTRENTGEQSATVEPKAAEPAVKAAHAATVEELPFSNRDDYEDASRGFIATLPDALIKDADGKVVWDLGAYAFLEEDDAPASVHPSLWRLAQLNVEHGLFQACERIYQIRGFDIANMTIVEGADVIAGRVQVVAPDKFLDFAVSENIIAGNAMARRAQYQFGLRLPKGVRGQVDAALGKTIARGTVTLFPPNDIIRQTGERRVIDGVEIVFQMAPNSEAPAEFHLCFPALRALNIAENATHLFHNLLPFRGAEVRDALAWSKYLNEAIELFVGKTDVLMAQHHWPIWGSGRIRDYLTKQRDLYKYVHDQTLRLINHGFTAPEIAEQVKLPESLAKEWFNRDYYGTVRHNAKAIYQKYLGWYDSNPAHLDPLPPAQAAKKYLEYMGGAEAIIRRARE